MLDAPSKTECPFCQSESTILFHKNSLPIFRCVSCQHRFSQTPHSQSQHIEKEFGDDYFSGGEGCYDEYEHQAKDLKRLGRYYSRILRKHGSENQEPRVLDLGCAAGFFLKGFVEDDWQGVGVEANSQMAEYARDKLQLDARHSTIEQFDSSEKFDAVTVVQVLPHLLNPKSCLDDIHPLLKESGLVLIETWNHRSITARLFGKWWHEYNPPSVLHWFTRASLSELLEESGFEVVKTGRPTKWISLGNGFAIVRKSMKDSRLASVFLAPTRLVPSALKVPYFFDDVFWILARKT